MDRCQEIIANMKMEECYSGLSLSFDGSEGLKKEIEEAINKVIEQTKMSPVVFDNSKDKKPAFYIEFGDEVYRDSGDFFTLVLKELKIDKCVREIVENS
ncbi:MAG: hypothetical protein RL113_146 [Pseudomonadota bacterium]|jgi:hypothetical protein